MSVSARLDLEDGFAHRRVKEESPDNRTLQLGPVAAPSRDYEGRALRLYASSGLLPRLGEAEEQPR
jgi:hypothetical protein